MEISAASLRRSANAIGKGRALLSIVGIASTALLVAALWSKRTEAGEYITSTVDRGDVDVTVFATGTVQAVKTVEVGSQTSGVVSWLGADFKSQVKRGQVIARLDPAIFQAQVENQQAALTIARASVEAATTDIDDQDANLKGAKANQEAARVARDDAVDLVKRDEGLRDVVANRDIEAAQAAAAAADARYQQTTAQVGQAEAALAEAKARLNETRAGVTQAQAELDQAKVNLDHTIITSPIDGVIVSRNVDVGQTVAASLQTPTLFVIANDLNNMQVLASIDEADVGQIHENVIATFTVDAYPGETFSGRISQIRLNAQELQNVVTYTAVIDFSNSDQRLLPGMTTNISVLVAHAEDVLRIPNAALRFQPVHPQQGQPQSDALDSKSAVEPTSTPQTGALGEPDNQPGSEDNGQPCLTRTVWQLDANRRLEPRLVKARITNGRVTAISESDLREGDVVVIGQNDDGRRAR